MNRLVKYVAAGAIAFAVPATLLAQMSQGGLDTPTTPPPAMGDAPATKPADAPSAELVESPVYAAWKGKAAGSSASYTMTVNQFGQTMSGKMVSTLKEITDSKVTLKQTVTSAMQPQAQESEETVEAKVSADKKWQVAGDGMAWKEEGTEKITVMGKEYECTKLAMSSEQMGSKMTGTAYYTAEVPGGMVKAEINASTPQGDVKISIVIDSFEVK